MNLNFTYCSVFYFPEERNAIQVNAIDTKKNKNMCVFRELDKTTGK